MIVDNPKASPTPPPAHEDLLAWRTAAAEQSRGASDDAIYAAIDRELDARGASGDLLDFGAGIGQLTRRLLARRRFRSIAGADILARPSDIPPEIGWHQVDLNSPLPLPPNSFDVVVAAEVIEHLENPRGVVREIFRLLRPGGLALLSTPNNESWRSMVALIVRGHFVAFGDTSYPAHITALVRQDLRRILVEAGLSNVSFAFTDVGGIPGLPARTWQSVLGGLFGSRARGLRFSDNVLVSATRPGAAP